MKDVMLDLETWGTRPGCAIRSIGAVFFDADKLGEEFYCNVDQGSCEVQGLTIDANTAAWWTRQSQAARDALEVNPQLLSTALHQFGLYFTQNGGERIWSHGANFDQPVIEAAYTAIGRKAPWLFWNSRCTRTLYDIAGVDLKKMTRSGTHHNALDDAKTQALAVQACFRKLAGQPEPAPTPTSNGVFG